MVTIKQIAERLGVSISTVSKGLNGASDISPELCQTILDTAVEMGYQTKRMKRADSKKLCIFVSNMDYESANHFAYDVILGFKQAAFRDEWSVTTLPVTYHFQNQEKYDTYMLKNGYSGAFFLGFSLLDGWIHQLENTTMATVLLDNAIKTNPHVAYVGTDSYEGIDAAVDHLISLGHRKIAFLNGSGHSMITEVRQQAFFESMSAHNVPAIPSLVVYGRYDAEVAQEYVPSFLEQGATAILCGTDIIAYGVLKECERLGYRVPQDISVIGADDLPLSAHMDVALTTIRQNRVQLGKLAYLALDGVMNQVPISKTLLRPQLIVRNSTAKVVDR